MGEEKVSAPNNEGFREPSANSPGGAGELRVAYRAITQRWGISEEDKRDALAAAMEMIRNPKCTKRTKILAMRVLTALEAQNMEQERRDL